MYVLIRSDLIYNPYILAFKEDIIVYNSEQEAKDYLTMFPSLNQFFFVPIYVSEDKLEGKPFIRYNDIINNEEWIENMKHEYEEYQNTDAGIIRRYLIKSLDGRYPCFDNKVVIFDSSEEAKELIESEPDFSDKDFIIKCVIFDDIDIEKFINYKDIINIYSTSSNNITS